MTYKYIVFEVEEQIAYIKLNRPSKLNALGMPVVLECNQVLNEIKSQPSIRILVITTTIDGMFSAGADVMELSEYSRNEAENLSTEAKRLFKQIRNLPIPVIAAVKGLCLTAGLELSVSCDLIIAADNAQFGQIEPQYGLTTAAGATQRLTQLIGPMKTRELLFTSKIIPANEALRIGLIDEVVSLSDFDNRVRELCNQITSNGARAIRDIKSLINQAIYEDESCYERETKTWGLGYEPTGGFVPEVRKRFEKAKLL